MECLLIILMWQKTLVLTLKQPKFYIFDLGVKRAMEGSLSQKISPKTARYGQAIDEKSARSNVCTGKILWRSFSLIHIDELSS